MRLIVIALCLGFVSGPALSQEGGDLRVASFNIRDFGQTKISKTKVRKYLAEIVRKFDIVAIQEISDARGRIPDAFLQEINATGRSYAYVVSERTGKQVDDKPSQEQYGFFYDAKRVTSLDKGTLFDDRRRDLFQREPFTAHFQLKNSSIKLTITQVHTRPESAVEEIGALYDVYTTLSRRYPDEENHLIVGDFNGGCTYAKPAELDKLKIRKSGFNWIIPDDADTTVSATTACAYDRIVVNNALKKHFVKWGIGSWFTDGAISDHWPVWASFRATAN